MPMYYCASKGGFYLPGMQPHGSVEISTARHIELRDKQALGHQIVAGEDGYPIAVLPVVAITTERLCSMIDRAADTTRRAVAGDPMRAVEYDRTRLQAEQFAAAGYQGEVPAMVAAWVTSERDAQAAAEDILREAAQYEQALVQVRTIRLQAKEQIRALMAAGDVDQAKQLTEQTTGNLAACVQGVGNA